MNMNKFINISKKNFSYISRKFAKPKKSKVSYFFLKRFFPHFAMTANQAEKIKKNSDIPG